MVATKGARHSTSRGFALRRGSSRPHTNSPNTAADVAKHGARSLAGSSQAANALAPAAAFACKQAGAGKARSSDETHNEFPSCPLPLRTSFNHEARMPCLLHIIHRCPLCPTFADSCPFPALGDSYSRLLSLPCWTHQARTRGMPATAPKRHAPSPAACQRCR